MTKEWKQAPENSLFQMELDEDTLMEMSWFYSRPAYQHIPKNVATLFLLILKIQLFHGKNADIIKQKYAYIHTLQTNPFMTPEVFNTTMEMFAVSQRLYFAMLRFVNRCKYKIAKVQVQSDLFLNPLDPASKHTFSILQDGKLYYFALADLVKMIQTSVTHSSNCFVLPIPCKNPYTNTPFRKHDLYNMYFQMTRAFVRMPALIELYFTHDFDIYRLKKYNENTLLHYVVEDKLKNSSTTSSITLFMEMENVIMGMNEVYISMALYQSVVNYMQPYLYLFLLCRYITDPYLRRNYREELKWKLTQFHQANPEFFSVKRFLNRSTEQRRCELWVQETPALVELPMTPRCNFNTTHLYDDTKYNSFLYRGYYNETNSYVDECVSYQVLVDAMTEQTIIYTDNPMQPATRRPRYVSRTMSDEEDGSDEEEPTVIYDSDTDEHTDYDE